MILKYWSDYLSIKRFNQIELSDFSIITWLNWAWKSHLLKSIELWNSVIEWMENSSIIYFNYETFKVENEWTYTSQQLAAEKTWAWNLFNQHIKNTILSWKNSILWEFYIKIQEISREKEKNIWNLTKEDINNIDIYNKLTEYKNHIKNFFKNNNNVKNNNQAKWIFSLIKNIDFSIDEISEENFSDLFKPYSFKNDFLPHELWKIVWDYYVKYRDNQINKFYNQEEWKTYKVLSDEEFINLHWPKPWDIINQILEKFDSLNYRVNSPEWVDHRKTFKLQLIDINDNTNIPDFSNLSSWEKILMALVASIYKTSSDNHFPDILLLDEIEASLHPSMVRNLLNVITEVFLQNWTKVILVSHSPTTIALSPEDSIFIMKRSWLERIEKQSKEVAISILSEWFATIQDGKVYFENIIWSEKKCIIFTEWKTDINHIITSKNKLWITDYDFDVFTCWCANKLKQFLMWIPDWLFSDKKIIWIFDSDNEWIKEAIKIWSKFLGDNNIFVSNSNSNVFSLLIPVPNQEFINYEYCPIEFLYDKSKLEENNFIEKRNIRDINNTQYIKDSGSFLNQSDLDSKNDLWFYKITEVNISKNTFSNSIISLFNESDFINFKPIFEKIKFIIEN